MTRVLVVDDSRFMRTVIGNALTEAGYEVETATNGVEAVDTAAEFDPAVVTMDVEMPEMNGIEAVERIMAQNPTLILMLSAYTDEGTDATLDALERGAIEFLPKPDGSGSRNIAHLADDVVEAVDELADADISALALARASASAYATSSALESATGSSASATTPVGTRAGSGSAAGSTKTARSGPAGPTGAAASTQGPSSNPGADADSWSTPIPTDDDRTTSDDIASTTAPVIVIGASTGGPKIAERLFAQLPSTLEATVLIVQHMPPEFTGRFATRLDSHSEYAVREATDGDRVGPGEALVAPGDFHLQVTDASAADAPDAPVTDGHDDTAGTTLEVTLDDGPRRHGLRPAIDETMETAAAHVSGPLCGVVLTGMGSDGAAGIEAIADAGGYTIAQDEATSPVFGIPCQAIETGCVEAVVPDDEIVPTIVDTFTASDGRNDGGDTAGGNQ
ncbi:protein-glutamate methylesterase CheB [Natrialba magadii ATCC 43099]|uniref:Protein-glutamate methylesterase/protein-glutamine glutaminase n=1 Tax=Natrialba magadii (strain ATCC 43099 / DSM 3394 / CCM 3739 / CIP 104546 / IAM 13178 / JCM 8861 / NBRC 102185 / NCIMB 2190 / MS3) TaxID=547559 RepID=D3SRS8_NATMM|nr:chemotaxis-specific protein-glutamate methyltransferase CheB [Natrialba magadii]ADD06702.1 protein-glutamate methylesterase CheB [Natrialba magadii ATCC 43099]ELY31837.1 chemotaxis-specific methylesterase [Natrialba magadii ATCC 43099]